MIPGNMFIPNEAFSAIELLSKTKIAGPALTCTSYIPSKIHAVALALLSALNVPRFLLLGVLDGVNNIIQLEISKGLTSLKTNVGHAAKSAAGVIVFSIATVISLFVPTIFRHFGAAEKKKANAEVIEERHRNKIQELEKEHADKLKKLNSDHKAALKNIEKEHEAAQKKAKDEQLSIKKGHQQKMEELESQLTEFNNKGPERVEAAKAKADAAIAAAEKAREAAVQEAEEKAKTGSAEIEAEKKKLEAEERDQKAKIASELEAALTSLAQDHKEAMEQIARDHGAREAALVDELRDKTARERELIQKITAVFENRKTNLAATEKFLKKLTDPREPVREAKVAASNARIKMLTESLSVVREELGKIVRSPADQKEGAERANTTAILTTIATLTDEAAAKINAAEEQWKKLVEDAEKTQKAFDPSQAPLLTLLNMVAGHQTEILQTTGAALASGAITQWPPLQHTGARDFHLGGTLPVAGPRGAAAGGDGDARPEGTPPPPPVDPGPHPVAAARHDADAKPDAAL